MCALKTLHFYNALLVSLLFVNPGFITESRMPYRVLVSSETTSNLLFFCLSLPMASGVHHHFQLICTYTEMHTYFLVTYFIYICTTSSLYIFIYAYYDYMFLIVAWRSEILPTM